MRMVFNEMKKIWNLKMMLLIAIICALFYSMFMGFHINHFPNGHPSTEIVDYSRELTQRYGTTLEEEEFSEFVQDTREALLAEAEAYIKKMPIFAEAGIYTYADYERVRDSDETQLETDAIWTLLGEECDFVQFKLQALNSIEESYYHYPEYMLNSFIEIRGAEHEKELNRFMQIKEREEYRNIMASEVLDATVKYAVYLAILTILAVLVLISPLVVTDRMRNIHLLQYTAEQGRDVFQKQLAAVLLSAFCLTTALVVIFGVIFSTNGTGMFWDNGITSFLAYTTFLADMTYGQYCIIYIVLLYVFCLGTAAIAFVLSRFSQNPITLILKLIPVFAAVTTLAVFVFHNTFSIGNVLYAGTGIWWIEPIACGFILLFGSALSLYVVGREKKVDVA